MRVFERAAALAEQVWVTGHSLGGALAVLDAARLKLQGITPHVDTSGQPREGFREFGDRSNAELAECHWRFVNPSDVVPHLPPGPFYRHCGQVKRIVRPGLLAAAGLADVTPPEFSETDLPPQTDDKCGALLRQLEINPEASATEGIQLEGRFALLGDHSMREYVRLLTEIRDPQNEATVPAS